jgi:hypothetical protein
MNHVDDRLKALPEERRWFWAKLSDTVAKKGL